MNITNYEFKARVKELYSYEQKIQTISHEYIGLDHQIDTYFNTKEGRLKLRQGHIENALIQYQRSNIVGAKESQIILYKHTRSHALKDILTTQLGVKVVVDKKRKIYFVDNIKIHFDEVKDLGFFIEVEARDESGEFTIEALKKQCDEFITFFELTADQFIDLSYSDMILCLESNL